MKITKEKITTLLSGMPEIRIIQLVRKSHSAKACPHKGNCLTEKEMVSRLHCLLVDLLKAQNQDLLKKIEGMKRESIWGHGTESKEWFEKVKRENEIYNQALEDVKQLLK